MKFSRSLYATVALIMAYCLLIGSTAEGRTSDADSGLRYTSYAQQWDFVAVVVYVAGAMGVIFLGWYWIRLAGAITSIARLLKSRGINAVCRTGKINIPIRVRQIGVLREAIRECLDSCAAQIADYEKQIKDLQIQVQLSRRREKNTEAIIYSIRDAVIVIDEFDKLLKANEAAEKLFMFNFENSQHMPIRELISNNYSEFLDFLSHSRQSKGQASKREIEFVKDESIRTFDCIVSCIYDKNRQVCGAVMVLHDITREKEISEMKNDFVSHVSHELKTPLASITAYSEMLADGEAEDEQTRREFYSIIQNQANRLNRLIEDILNTSRIESGLIKVNKEPISLAILIEEQLQMIKSYAEEKNIEVTGQKPIVFDQVLADRDMISQVIINLLSNAVKYTQHGGAVRVETQVDEVANLIRVDVSDTGVGIPEDEIEHVFDKYYRVGANKKQAKGTGLGLNLVKQIIEKVHGGRVFVKSQVGVGSTFGFELPLAKVCMGSVV
ncbi:MAG: PAS domain-containing protein [Sedimentisphaerales bacterium]|nr:PAS domain-containing protein [Sedimentisphaerales bacterium]